MLTFNDIVTIIEFHRRRRQHRRYRCVIVVVRNTYGCGGPIFIVDLTAPFSPSMGRGCCNDRGPPWPGSGPTWPGSEPTWPGSGPTWPGSGPTWPGSGPTWPGSGPTWPGSGSPRPGRIVEAVSAVISVCTRAIGGEPVLREEWHEVSLASNVSFEAALSLMPRPLNNFLCRPRYLQTMVHGAEYAQVETERNVCDCV